MSDGLILESGMLESLLEVMPAHYTCVFLYLLTKARERGQDWTAINQETLRGVTGLTRNMMRRCISRLVELKFIGIKTDKYRTLIHIYNIIDLEINVKKSTTECAQSEQVASTQEPFREHAGSTQGANDAQLGSPLEPLPEVSSSSVSTSTPTATSKSTPRFNFIKPLPEEVTAYAVTIGFKLDGAEFCDFYESKGWVIGKSPMKNWKAAVRTWKKTAGPQALIAPKPAPKLREPEPEPDMTFEEMQEIRRKNIPQKNAAKPPTEDVVPTEVVKEETVPASDVNALVVKLAGGARRIP